MKKTIAVLALLCLAGNAQAKSKISGYLFRSTGLAVNSTPTVDLMDVDRLSVEVAYSSATNASSAFTDGSKSVANITVSSNFYVFNNTPTITINNINVVYTPGVASTSTAKAISDAIMANASLTPIIVSTWSGTTTGIVFATSTVPGVNAYSISTSSSAALLPSGSIFTGGVASQVNSVTDIITATNTLTTGMSVFLSTAANVALPGLTWGTTYFAIPLDATSFKLALTSTGAVAGLAIDISTSSTGGGNFIINVATYTAGSAGFAWQASDDNTNWWTLPAISSVTVPGSGVTVIAWDFGAFNYHYLRMNFTGPTRGGVVLDVAVQGKKDD